MIFIKDFKEIGKGDAATAGGKGASLGEMATAGIPVPPGFVILASAFEKFLDETDLHTEIDTILHTVKTDEMRSVEHASEKIQKLILEAKMPRDIGEEIQRQFKTLDSRYVAVRSSATAEDSDSAAWAGQLDTFLNTTKENLLKNVQKCWASLFTPRAIFYRFEHFQQHPNILENVGVSMERIHEEKISVAVVVQEMIQSEISGIAFSVHPVTEDRNQLIIEAGWGLGEAIVSGQITPDSYVVEKDPRRIIDTNIASQERSLIRAQRPPVASSKGGNRRIEGNGERSARHASAPDTGGNEWVDVPQEKRGQQKLSEEQIFELAELVIRIEKHYGFPCDIEWALAGGKFYITQSRPITTLTPQPPISGDVKKKFEKEPIHFIKTLERDQTLFVQGLWAQGLDIDLEKRFGMKNPYRPMILTYATKDNLQVWENVKSVQWMLDAFLEKNQKNTDFIDKIIEEYEDLTKELQAFWSRGAITDKNEIQRYANLVRKASLNISTCYYVGMDERTPKKIQDLVVEVRKEDIFYSRNNEFVRECVAAQEDRLRDFSPFVLPWELDKLPSENILRSRAKGVVLIAGKDLFVENIQDFSQKHPEYVFDNLNVMIGDNEPILGLTAFPGKAVGRVRIVKNLKRLQTVEKGNILVAPMTTPDYMPAMQRAAAFVTDEGGVTCHAAVVAREMKKPCIIGTKIATQVLKDGDMVEVDADKGVVRIIERAENVSSEEKYYRKLRFIKKGRWATYPMETENWHNAHTSDYTEKHFGVWRETFAVCIFGKEYENHMYVPERFVKKLHARIKEVTDSDPKGMEKLFVQFYEEREEAHKKVPKIVPADLSKLSNNELAKVFVKNRDASHRIVIYDQFTWLAEDYWPSLMDDVLVNKIGLVKGSLEYNDCLFALIKPREISTTLEEKRSVAEYVLRVKSRNETIENAAKALASQYGYMPVLTYGIPWGAEKYEQELQSAIAKDEESLKKEFLELRNYMKLRDEDIERVVKKYKIAAKDLQIFTDFGLAIDTRNEAEYVASLCGFYLMRLYDEIVKRLGCSVLDLRTLFESEIVDCLEGKTKVLDCLSKKGTFVVWGMNADTKKKVILSSEESEKAFAYLEEQDNLKNKKTNDKLNRGITANGGKVRGKIRKVPTPNDNHKVQEGDILVAYSTMVDNLPAMKRAVAIVTESGGLTCHAAVVAREFGIPCIVGLKNAMSDFQDGDMVEVDADKGVVKILTKSV